MDPSETWRNLLIKLMENGLSHARFTKRWSDDMVRAEHAARLAMIQRLHIDDHSPERTAALCAAEPFDPNSDLWNLGMGGASAPDREEPEWPYLDPHQEITVWDEILDRREGERSVSTSAGVGRPLIDPTEAVREIEENPAGKREWWPDPDRTDPGSRTPPPTTPLHARKST